MPRLLFTAKLARFTVWCGAFLPALASPAFGSAQEKLDYGRDIRPILSDNCFACHGPDPRARQAKLRLDLTDDAVRDRGGYAAIVPGDVEASELVARIR